MSSLPKAAEASTRKDGADDARKITEMKIEMLRKAMDAGGPSRTGGTGTGENGGRWRGAPAKKPLRSDCAKGALETKPGRASLTKQLPADSRTRSQDTGDVAVSEPGSQAASNLQAAVGQQSKEALEVEAFLASLGLDRYVSIFMENGFDCMEVVGLMEETHMRDMGMATGHALKLRKKLAELNPAPAPAQVPVAAPAAAMRSPAAPAGGTETETGTSSSLLHGEFDEEGAKAGFQEAVRAWREGQNANKSQAEVPVTPSQLAPGSFWSSLGGDEVDLERCSTPMTLPEKRISCYQCYKQFYAKHAVERCSPLPDQSVRWLCSEACADLWMASMQAKVAELQQRHEKLAQAEELERVTKYELEATAATVGTDTSIVA